MEQVLQTRFALNSNFSLSLSCYLLSAWIHQSAACSVIQLCTAKWQQGCCSCGLPCPALPCPALPCPALPCPKPSSHVHFIVKAHIRVLCKRCCLCSSLLEKCFSLQDKGKRLDMGPVWSPKNGFGTCCGFPVNGFNDGGNSNGSSGGSAISPSGWLFNICNETSRCDHQPNFPLALWFVQLWEVSLLRTAAPPCSECQSRHSVGLSGNLPLDHTLLLFWPVLIVNCQ